MFRTLLPTVRQSVRSYSAQASSSPQQQASAVLGGLAEKSAHAWKLVTSHAGNALGAYKEPIVGNVLVAREVLKQVYVAEKLSPPTVAEITYTYQNFYNQARHTSFWMDLWESGAWKKCAIYAVEAYGIFKLGEMVGRRHIVGYGLDESKVVVE